MQWGPHAPFERAPGLFPASPVGRFVGRFSLSHSNLSLQYLQWKPGWIPSAENREHCRWHPFTLSPVSSQFWNSPFVRRDKWKEDEHNDGGGCVDRLFKGVWPFLALFPTWLQSLGLFKGLGVIIVWPSRSPPWRGSLICPLTPPTPDPNPFWINRLKYVN